MDISVASAAMDIALFCRLNRYRKTGFPICHSELGILLFVSGSQEPVSPAMLCGLLEISKPRVTAALKSLCGMGYLERIPSKQDGRSFILALTPQGRELSENACTAYSNVIGELRNGLGTEDFALLIQLIHRANAILKK